MKDFWSKPECPKCCSDKGFTFHFNLPSGDDSYPNECKSCGCFCNVFGEIRKDGKNESQD